MEDADQGGRRGLLAVVARASAAVEVGIGRIARDVSGGRYHHAGDGTSVRGMASAGRAAEREGHDDRRPPMGVGADPPVGCHGGIIRAIGGLAVGICPIRPARSRRCLAMPTNREKPGGNVLWGPGGHEKRFT